MIINSTGNIFLQVIFAIVMIQQCAKGQDDEPAQSALCSNPNGYALCAYANCTVNDDGKTASCGCYSFSSDNSVVRVDAVHDETVQSETEQVCDSTFSCWTGNVDRAPICSAIQDNILWPTADIVSTFSTRLQDENEVRVRADGTYYDYWECSAAPGRYVPVCMLAPCVLSEPTENPYYYGQSKATCICPLVEVTVDYRVAGGLQDPCSAKPTQPGDYVQAAGDAILEKFTGDPDLMQDAWESVKAEFYNVIDNSEKENSVSGGNVVGASNSGTTDSSSTTMTSTDGRSSATGIKNSHVMMGSASLIGILLLLAM